MDMSAFHRQPGASACRISMTALASLGLTLLGFDGVARAADVTVQPAAGAGFVVTDNTGASQRFKVLESGPVFLGGLVGSPPTEKQALCYDTTTGQVGPCPAAKNLAFCVPNALASPRFVDNMDGTLTDMTTCLMWEMKTGTVGSFVDCSTPPTCQGGSQNGNACTTDADCPGGSCPCGDPHGVNNLYKWCNGTFPSCTNSSNPPDGVLFTDFLQRVNGQLCASPPCPSLGGHSDWRVPTLSELLTIVDPTQGLCGGGSGPCIDSAFGPTRTINYWSASTVAGSSPEFAWGVLFNGTSAGPGIKPGTGFARAVRGGL